MTRTIDAQIGAALFGIQQDVAGEMFKPDGQFWTEHLPGVPVTVDCPAFSTDRNACAYAEQRIVDRGLEDAYLNAVHELALQERARPLTAFHTEMFMVGPDLRCRAMLRALGQVTEPPPAPPPLTDSSLGAILEPIAERARLSGYFFDAFATKVYKDGTTGCAHVACNHDAGPKGYSDDVWAAIINGLDRRILGERPQDERHPDDLAPQEPN